LVIATGGAAGAGGWAVTTLDEHPAPAAGQDVEVGFTIRQHGVTPVALEDVSVTVTDPAGGTRVFPAVPEGPVGHYVAVVSFPDSGTYRWSVQQGWFAEQPLGSLSVPAAGAASAASAVASDGYRFSAVARYGLIVIMAAGLCLIVVPLVRRSWRPGPVA
jgi:hypothetical protein